MMKQPAKRIDRYIIESQNTQHTHHISHLRRVLEQFDSGYREPNKCGYCSTIGSARVGGSAMTLRDCGICGREQSFPNTATDVLCDDCAAENNLCKQCGADQELKNRRKPRPYESKAHKKDNT